MSAEHLWESSPTTPEQRLLTSVLTQAFMDAFAGEKAERGDAVRGDLNAVQAMRFLTDKYGRTAQWRNTLCDLLGMNGDVLAARVRAMLDGDLDPPESGHLTPERLHHARARWKRISTLKTAA